MNHFKIGSIVLFMATAVFTHSSVFAQKNQAITVDICVYGGTSGGVIAAYTAAKMGKSVILIEPGKHLGGMTSGGLGYTDIGNKYVVTGLARDFYRRIGQHYGKFEQWVFEPNVAETIFNEYAQRGRFEILKGKRIVSASKVGRQIRTIVLEDAFKPTLLTNKIIRATVFIDCSYEGDLMARAGVSYTIGREANSDYQETINGVKVTNGHQMPDGINPYKIPGDPKSGLLWGITPNVLQVTGSGDNKVQAYNFRITLTNVPENRIPITKPRNYNPHYYDLLVRMKEKQPWKSLNDIFIWSLMPNGKTDINNRGGFSTDMIGMNWEYPDASYQRRNEIWKAHEDYTKGLLYFLGHDSRIPEKIKDEMNQWGYPRDEYPDNDHWTPQLYIREARRMKGELVMTQHYCQGRKIADDGVAMAAYTMDSHNCDRQVVNGVVQNEGNVEVGGFGPYPVAYRAIVPQPSEVENLLVPVCLSATHIAYGSIRMEPVFMVLGQSAAVAACQAIDRKIPVQKIDIKALQNQLNNNPLVDGSTPEILVDNNDDNHVRIIGEWKLSRSGGYGPDCLIDTTKGKLFKSVTFIPEVIKPGNYNMYAYFPKIQDGSTTTCITVFDGNMVTEKVINRSEIQVAGQTSGEWVPLGLYILPKGNKTHVTISNKNADGTIIADAILFVPAK